MISEINYEYMKIHKYQGSEVIGHSLLNREKNKQLNKKNTILDFMKERNKQKK